MSEASPVSLLEVRETVTAIVGSRDFPGSRRLGQLLSYLVDRSIGGDQPAVTQQELAEQVFERGPDFDPENDAIVRVEVSKLRKALKHFYEHSLRPPPLMILIPRGSYQARFERLPNAVAAPVFLASGNQFAASAADQTIHVTATHCDATRELSNSLVNELELRLMRLPGLRVVSASQQRSDVGTGDEFTLAINVAQCQNLLRIGLRLLRQSSGEVFWAERFDADAGPEQLFATIDQVASVTSAHVADVYSGVINATQISDLTRLDKQAYSSEEAMLLFYRHLHLHSDQSYKTARYALEQAWRNDRGNAILTALLVDARRSGFALGFTQEEDPAAGCLELAQQALALAPQTPACYVALGFVQLHMGKVSQLVATVDALLQLPYLSPCYRGDAGVLLAFAGDWDRGCTIVRDTLPLLAEAPHSYAYPLFLDAYRREEYEQALQIADGFRPSPLFWQPLMRALAYARLGNRELARRFAAEVLASRPAFPALGERWIRCFIPDPTLGAHLLQSLELAGISTGTRKIA